MVFHSAQGFPYEPSSHIMVHNIIYVNSFFVFFFIIIITHQYDYYLVNISVLYSM